MEKSNLELQRKQFDEYIVIVNDVRYRKIFKFLQNLQNIKKTNHHILEIGCSGGEFLELLKNNNWKVSGFEISKKAASRGLKRGIDIRTGDANEKIPFTDNSFDIIIAGEIIEHTFNDLEFLKECKRILKQDGILIITTPNLISLKNRILMLLGLNPRFAVAPYHYHVYTLKLIRELFQKARFKKTRISGSYVIYTKNREKILGTLFEKLGNILPSLSEHFIIFAKK